MRLRRGVFRAGYRSFINDDDPAKPFRRRDQIFHCPHFLFAIVVPPVVEETITMFCFSNHARLPKGHGDLNDRGKLGLGRTSIGNLRVQGKLQARICNDHGQWLYWMPEPMPNSSSNQTTTVSSTVGDAV